MLLLPASLLLLLSTTLAHEDVEQRPLSSDGASSASSPLMRRGTWRRSVADCPPLAPRLSSAGPAGPWDLRPDDFASVAITC